MTANSQLKKWKWNAIATCVGDRTRVAKIIRRMKKKERKKNDEETWSYCDLGWSVNLGSCMI